MHPDDGHGRDGMHLDGQSAGPHSSVLMISATTMMGCISDSEHAISIMEKSLPRDTPEVIMAAPTVMDVRYASAVIHSSSADPASASSRLEVHLSFPVMAIENTSTAQCESDVSTVHGASSNIGKA